jgi:hypothetical protein
MAVGVFAIVGILCMSYLSIKLGKLELFWRGLSPGLRRF